VEAAERIESAEHVLPSPADAPPRLTGVVRMSDTDGFSAYIAAPAVPCNTGRGSTSTLSSANHSAPGRGNTARLLHVRHVRLA